MLNPKTDRLNYGSLLEPDLGYKVDFAIGTTYSLDLNALIGASLSLGLSEETDSSLMNNPVFLLEALNTTAGKIALFCENGQIHLPSNQNKMFILLEQMVFDVTTGKRRGIAHYPSFHPKMWLIRYISNEGNVKYRFIILSRNLTFDRSWDVTFSMDGEVTGEAKEKNQPLCDFLEYLKGWIRKNDQTKAKIRKIKDIIAELPYVQFEVDGRLFKDYQFLPIGIRKQNGEYYNIMDNALFTDAFQEVFIMSPFVSNDIIKKFNDRRYNSEKVATKYMLVTRKETLRDINPENCSNFEVYTMKDAVADGESQISDDESNIKNQDIHAKIYMTRMYSWSKLYLGSMNASHNAAYGNIEFMLCLDAPNRYMNLGTLSESIFNGPADGKDNPFEPTEVSSLNKEDVEGTDLADIVKNITRMKGKGSVEEIDGRYNLSLQFDNYTSEEGVTIRPLLSNKTETINSSVTFKDLDITQLSEFFVISVNKDGEKLDRVIVIPVSGLPENRVKEVISSVVSDKPKFFEYIAYLLGDNAISSALEIERLESVNGSGKYTPQIPALYEKMLQTAATNPEKFRDIEYLIKSISKDGVVPEDFEELYKVFMKVVKLK